MSAISVVAVALVISVAGCTSAADMSSGHGSENQESMQESSMESGNSLVAFADGYYRYDKGAYENAIDEGKVVFLDFYANWCPVCVSERPNIISAFDGQGWDDVVGFQVHYRDSETQPFDEDLARKYGIAQQYTKVIVKGDEVLLKTTSFLSMGQVVAEIEKARGA